MPSIVKSYSISVLIHASIVAALFAIPAAPSKQFSNSGLTQVIAIEATQETPSPTTSVSIEPEPIPDASDVNSLVNRIAQSNPAQPNKFRLSRSDLDRSDISKRHPPAAIPDLSVDYEMLRRRRKSDHEVPQVRPEKTPDRPRTRQPTSPLPIARPPIAATVPIEQMVGIEKEESVDLSSNRPPDYPPEAISKQLEGVVMLELSIDEEGSVTSVTLIRSSGHRILDQAAINAVSSWRGTPAKRRGRPIESTERLPIRFRL